MDILKFSEYLVQYFNYYQEPITNKKLQKILYYIQGWHLAYFGSPLFNEKPEAWRHGPVYPSVYQKYKPFQFNALASSIKFSDTDKDMVDSTIQSFGLSDDQLKLIENVINHYGNKSAFELELRSHNEAPWLEARTGLSDMDISQKPISIDIMYNFFKSKIPHTGQ